MRAECVAVKQKEGWRKSTVEKVVGGEVEEEVGEGCGRERGKGWWVGREER